MQYGFVGGIAGRQSRGVVYDSYSLAQVGFTSAALLNDVVTVNNKTDFTACSLCNFTFGDIVDNYIDSREIFEKSIDTFTIDFVKNTTAEGEDVNVVSAYSGIVISTEDTSDTIAMTSLSARYFTDISAKDGYIMPDVFHNNYTSARVFQLMSVVNNLSDTQCKLTVSSDLLMDDLKDSSTLLTLNVTSFNINNAYCVATYNNNNISELAICTVDDNTYFGVNGMSDIKLVTPDVTRVIVRCNTDVKQYVDPDKYSAATASLIVQFDISLTDLGNIINTTYDSSFNKTPTSALQIVLAPLIHAGGYCGEYIFSDMSEKSFLTIVDNSTIGLYDFKDYSLNNIYSTMKSLNTDLPNDNDILTRQYSAYNTISEFIADMSFDTMNKSNSDLLSAYNYTSANSLQKLKFKNIRQIHSNHEFVNSVFNSKFLSRFVRYVNYTTDAMPAVIVNEMHGADHSKSKTHEPNYGITWLDQLFSNSYAYAHTYNDGNDSLEEAYINSIAETSAHISKKNYVLNLDDKIDCWKDNTKIFDTYLTLQDDEYQLAITENAYITTQQSRRGSIIIKEPQYLSCRIGMLHDGNVSYETSIIDNYYDKVPIKIANAPFVARDEAEQCVVDAIHKIDKYHPVDVKPAYTYTYSSDSAFGLPILPLTLGYTDNYVFANYELEHAALNKAYALSSDSYKTISALNSSYKMLPEFVHNNDALDKNSLVFGYIPGSADILSCLDQDVSRHLYCSGISADDIQYMLVVDAEKRPIFDVKLDVTAADNDGYIVDFEKIQTMTRTETGDISGLAINIVNG